jgi:hypothetical protein
MTTTQITEETLSIADDLTISELLAQPELADVTVRFICGVRKTLFSHTPEGGLAEIESLISRIYHRLGNERRSAAFAASPARENDKAPKPEPVPARPVAPDLTLDNAVEKARNVIQGWVNKEEPKRAFTFDEIKRAVSNIHTSGSKRDWSPSDAETVSSGAKRWEQTLQTAMRKLRDLDEIHYRASKSDYFVLR